MDAGNTDSMDWNRKGVAMKVMTVLFLAAALFSLVGTAGCRTGRPFSTSALHASGFSGETKLANSKSTIAGGRSNIVYASDQSPNPDVQEQSTTTSSVSHHAQAKYIQSAGIVVDSQPTASLITLGPNDDLDSIIKNASGVVLIDYYADWCGPCRRQGGILHDMESSAHQNGALIVKVDVDQHPNLASKFRVSSLPTLMLVKNGQIVERQTGIADHQKVASYLKR